MFPSSKWTSAFGLLLTCISISGLASAQDCSLTLQGTVIDHHTDESLPYVSVYERDLERGTVTDDKGQFHLRDLCAGELHLEFAHVGCETVEVFLVMTSDTTIEVHLHHNASLLGEVEVRGRRNVDQQVGSGSIGRSEIEGRSSEDLTSMLTDITGLSAVQNGAALAKPIYHGMTGNRLTILNNGVAQSGQQWGNDHAPEIDPYSADRMTIIQGVNTLAQNGPDIGGMVLVEVSPITKDPHLHGNVNYSFLSNGAGHSVSGRMEKSGEWAAWRMTLSAKKIGDRRTPEHFLTNTANEQLNGSLLIEKTPTAHWHSSLYLSTFNTEIGILRGSHIGNLTDLNDAFSRETPFFTEDRRSYSIADPRQVVSHHLLKFKNTFESRVGLLDITYAGQLNARKEYDVRRGGRDSQASLDLDQSDHFLESVLRFRPDSALSWKAGLQYRFTRNINDPGTGILPLIPDYQNQMGSAFMIAKWHLKRLHLSAGARVDIRNIYALPISNTIPRVIERRDLTYTSPSAVATIRYDVTDEFIIEGELGRRQRSPEVNELFSNGLHQGVSGIEEGDDGLENETGLMSRLSASYHINEKYFITATAYQNRLDDFIYLVPQEELRLTIRGAFPLFQYEQIDALMRGVDLTMAAEIGKHWRVRSSFSYLKGEERESGPALVGVPANSGRLGLHYETAPTERFESIHLSLTYSHTMMRDDLLVDNTMFPDRSEDSPLMGQDFVPPPESYSLVGLKMDVKKRVAKLRMNFGVRVDNLLNLRYRDYLDRQRYFTDAAGRNVTVRVGWKF